MADRIAHLEDQIRELRNEENDRWQQDEVNRRRDNRYDPKLFDPKTMLLPRWLADLDSYFDAIRVAADQHQERKRILLRYLNKDALTALVARDPNNQLDYNELRAILEERFAPQNGTISSRREFETIKQKATEELSDFGDRVLLLLNKAFPDLPQQNRETLAVHRFISGLTSNYLKEKLLCEQIENITQAVTRGRELAMAREVNLCTSGQVNVVEQGQIEKLQNLVKQMQEIQEKWENDRKTQSNRKYCNNCRKSGHSQGECRNQQRLINEIICLKCRRQGHTANNCRVPMQNQKPIITCYCCQKVGHFARDCRNKNLNQRGGIGPSQQFIPPNMQGRYNAQQY